LVESIVKRKELKASLINAIKSMDEVTDNHGESPEVIEKKEHSFLVILVPADAEHFGSCGFCGGNG